MVSVLEIDYAPEFIGEVREEVSVAARRFHKVVQRAREMAEKSDIKLILMFCPSIRSVTCSASKQGYKRICW
jgi:hypothetical protein